MENVTRYCLLVATEAAGGALLFWNGLPIFRALASHPGERVDIDAFDLKILIPIVLIQAAYWYRIHAVPLPSFTRRDIAGHALLFVARLNFIFGGSLYSVALFRHLPQLAQVPNLIELSTRSTVLLALLFALFCLTLELERFGKALTPLDR